MSTGGAAPGGGADVRVAVLGPLEVRVDGAPVVVGGPKQRVLLSRLVLAAGRPIASELLAEDLWGARPPRNARHALQAQVSRLRSILPAAIEHGHAGYRLAPGAVSTDLDGFTRLCERGRSLLAAGSDEAAAAAFDEATGFWRGAVLDGVPDAPGLRPAVLRLQEAHRAAQTDRAEAHIRAGNAGAVIGPLRERIESDPLHERSWLQLMTALHRRGEIGEALSVYRAAREVFITELGAEPGPEIAELHASIRGPEARSGRGAAGRTDAGGTARPAGMRPGGRGDSAADGLVGRSVELAVLTRFWRESRRGVRIVTISGEPGAGKSRLARAFADGLAAQGVRVLSGRCDPSVSVPYRPFAGMLRDLSASGDAPLQGNDPGGRHAAALARILPDPEDGAAPHLSGSEGLDSRARVHRLFDAVAAWMSGLASAAPTAVIIDDLQWADDQTLRMLLHLTRTPRHIPALIMVTIRDREVQGPAESPARRLLRQSEVIAHLPVGGLGPADARRLLTGELARTDPNASLPPGLAERAAAASGGNALFLVEMARQFALPGEHGGFTGADGAGTPLPSGVRDVVQGRAAQLSAGTRRIITAAAVIGVEFDAATLHRVAAAAGIGADARVRTALAEAEHFRIVGPAPGGRYRFCHELVRIGLYDGVGPARAARLHLHAAQAIEQAVVPAGQGAADGAASALAHHYARAVPQPGARVDDGAAHRDVPGGDVPGGGVLPAQRIRERAVHWCARAGTVAMDRDAPSQAAAHFAAALDLAGAHGDPARRCDLTTSLGRARYRAGDPAFRATLLAAARLAIACGDADRLAAAAVANSRGWWSSTAEVDDERVEVIETALEWIPRDDAVTRPALLSAWAVENVRDPQMRATAVRCSAEALEAAYAGGDEAVLAAALSNRHAVLYAALGDPAECLRVNARLLDLARRHGDRALRLSASVGLAQSAMTLGELAAADRHLDRAVRLAEVLGEPARLWLTTGWQAMREATRGRFAAAEERMTEVLELGLATDQPDAATWYAGQVFSLRLMEGRLTEIVDAVSAQVDDHAAAIPAWRAAKALALAHAGRTDEAGRILDGFTGDSFAGLPRDILWMQAMSYLCGTCEILGDAAAAEALYTALSPYSGLMAHNGTLDAGPVDLHLGAMALVAGDEEVARRNLQAAEAQCRRAGADAWLPRCRSLVPGAATA